jgi:hypothetical protein
MTASAVSPCRTPSLSRIALPALLSALRRLASICLSEVTGADPRNWLRFVVRALLSGPSSQFCLEPAGDAFPATLPEPRASDPRRLSQPPTRLVAATISLPDDVLGTKGR